MVNDSRVLILHHFLKIDAALPRSKTAKMCKYTKPLLYTLRLMHFRREARY